jgi:glycosyltransferase involved in cell wall biosynthesis
MNLTKELKLSGIVHFSGHQEHVLKYYNAMDMLVIASNSEGLSLVMLEAMLSGLPVIATDVGAARDVITDKESGIIVPPNDVNALKEGIQYLLDHENERMKIIRKGQKVVQSKFDKQSSLNSMLNFYGN